MEEIHELIEAANSMTAQLIERKHAVVAMPNGLEKAIELMQIVAGLSGISCLLKEILALGSERDRVIVPISNLPQQAHILRHSRNLEAEIDHLEAMIRQLTDVQRRMREMLQDEVDFLEAGLDRGEWESYDSVKRRLSRLKGARDYRGRTDALYCTGCSELVKER